MNRRARRCAVVLIAVSLVGVGRSDAGGGRTIEARYDLPAVAARRSCPVTVADVVVAPGTMCVPLQPTESQLSVAVDDDVMSVVGFTLYVEHRTCRVVYGEQVCSYVTDSLDVCHAGTWTLPPETRQIDVMVRDHMVARGVRGCDVAPATRGSITVALA